VLSYLKLKFGFFGVFCAGGLGDLAVLVIKYVICKKAFNKLKKRRVSTLLLAYFYLKRPLILETDALDSIIAAIYS